MSEKKEKSRDFKFLRKFKGLPNLDGFLGNIIFFLHNGFIEQKRDFVAGYISDDDATLKANSNQGTQTPIQLPGSVGSKLIKNVGRNKKKFETRRKTTCGITFETPSEKDIEAFEVQMAAEICRYMFMNNFFPHEMQILSNSKPRLEAISEKFDRLPGAFELVPMIHTSTDVKYFANRVTIVILAQDMQDGDEQVFCQTIRKAVDLSSDGVIILGYFSLLLGTYDQKWTELVDEMFGKGYLNPYLRLYCEVHDVVCGKVRNPKDFQLASPKGGCLNPCYQKECGHFCDSVCHPRDRRHEKENMACEILCDERCSNGHRCIMMCHEKCSCKEGCIFQKPCSHQPNNKTPCIQQCERKYPCGHNCDLICNDCPETRKHEECDHICKKLCIKKAHQCSRRHACGTPCQPCMESVTYKLKCTHELTIRCCDPRPDESRYKCMEPCKRTYALCNHPCTKKCYEECGICEKPYPRRHPDCGHEVEAQCHVPITVDCRKKVPPSVHSRCKHDVLVSCYRSETLSAEEVAVYCSKPCNRLLSLDEGDCGHYCYGSCWKCYQGRFHVRCTNPCEKRLICGHECLVECSLVCPPCSNKCNLYCEHYQCPYECGVPCKYICQEPCPYSCPHFSCTKKCGEVCDRRGCFEHCTKILKCGHKCIGYCGERCPKLCRICDEAKLLKAMFTGQNEIDPTDRFIYIPTCGHTIEESSLTQWLNSKEDGDEIRLKSCPICRYSLGLTLRRYSTIIHASFNEVNKVKLKIFGEEQEIKEICDRVRSQIIQKLSPDQPPLRFTFFAKAMLKTLHRPLKSIDVGDNECNSMYKNKAEFINWIFTIWEKAEDLFAFVEHLWRPQDILSFHELYGEVFQMMQGRIWPLHPNELNSLRREMKRIRDAELLYRRQSLEEDEHILRLASSREGRQRFAEAEMVLKIWSPYLSDLQEFFKTQYTAFSAVQSYTLDITEQERREILMAFGSRAGRWFKCSRGHVYVVTECGGVTELSFCNECGEPIGGENHQVISGNQLASEMDGAEAPLYPTALDRP